MNTIIRGFSESDLDFIVLAVNRSSPKVDHSQTPLLAEILEVEPGQFDAIIKAAFSHGFRGGFLDSQSYLVAAVNDRPIACLARWVQPPFPCESDRGFIAILMNHLRDSGKRLAPNPALLEYQKLLVREPRTLQIESVYVLPEFQRRGVMSRLLDATVEEIESCSSRMAPTGVELHVDASNVAAIEFYLDYGFQLVYKTSGTIQLVERLENVTLCRLRLDL